MFCLAYIKVLQFKQFQSCFWNIKDESRVQMVPYVRCKMKKDFIKNLSSTTAFEQFSSILHNLIFTDFKIIWVRVLFYLKTKTTLKKY